jgi:uncharacterized membrane protein
LTGEPAKLEEVEPEIVSEVSRTLAPLMKDPAKATVAAAKIIAIQESYSGPIPHPRHLAEIERIAPGAARQIIDSVSLEQRHRHRMETLEMVYPYMGLLCAITMLLLCIACAVYLAVHDATNVALARCQSSAPLA